MKKLVLPILLLILFSCKKNNSSTGTNTLPDLNISPAAVKLNPTGNAPLSALLTYSSKVAGYTKIIIKGRDGTGSDITQQFNDNGLNHSIPILGLYPNFNNTVQVDLVDNTGKVLYESTLNIQTGLLPVNVPTSITVDNANYAAMEPGLNLVSSFSGYPNPPQVPYVLDNYGRIRWYLDFSNNPDLKNLFYDCGIARLQNGNYYFADQPSGKIYEVDVMGKIINTWPFPGYVFNHNVTEMPNGNFLITVSQNGSTHTNGTPTVEDNVLEIERTTGKILNNWDLKVSLNEYRTTLGTDPQDWIHTNAVIYDPSDNTIIVSGRVQGVFKLTFNNQVKWIMGPHRGWGKNRLGQDLNQFLLTPLDANGNKITDTTYVNGWVNHPDFEWNWYQHSTILIPNGDLMMFDNGAERNYNPSGPSYSRAVEFKIDPVAMTVQQKWEYGKERGQETFSSIVSSVNYLTATNHVLFSPGYYVGNAQGIGGKIVEVDYATKNVVFQTSVTNANYWGWHRVYRLPLYPNNNQY